MYHNGGRAVASASSTRYDRGVQKVDLIVDGVVVNVDQRSNSPALIARVVSRMQTAKRIEVRRHAATPPPPLPNPHERRRLGHVVFFAQVTEEAIAGMVSLPADWTAAVTADRAYRSPLLDRLIAELKSRDRTPRPWCDCREPDGEPKGTPYREALKMAADYGLGEPIGQAESSAELKHALDNGARDIVANPNAWTPDERADVTAGILAGELAVTGEMLEPDPAYSARGVPIYSVTYFVGFDNDRYIPLSAFLAASSEAQRGTFCVYHGAALRSPDWPLLR